MSGVPGSRVSPVGVWLSKPGAWGLGGLRVWGIGFRAESGIGFRVFRV